MFSHPKINLSDHPVCILLGPIESCKEIVEDMISEMKSQVSYSDISNFDLTYSSLNDFFNFITLHSVVLKICICIIKKKEPNLIAALLKKIEAVPEGVKLIIVADSLPQVLLSRGIVWRIQEKQNIFQDQNWLEELIMNSMKSEKKDIIAFCYKTWHKLLEVRRWLANKQITDSVAMEMMASIVEVAQIRKRIESL